MKRGAALILAAWLAPATAQDAAPGVPTPDMIRVLREQRTDSEELERRLQALDWEQFRAVVEAIPKLKADVDAYGPAGWEFVKRKYRTQPWHRNIEKLDPDERDRLAALIDSSAGQRD